MYNKLLTLLISALLIGNAAFAKILRVKFPGQHLSGVDYDHLQEAHDAALAGDTVQVYGQDNNSATITKQLVILGFGYNFSVHPGLQVVTDDDPSYAASVTFGAGSDGTIVKGVKLGSVYIGSNNSTPVSNITFERCNISSYLALSNYTSYGDISNIKVISCAVYQIRENYGLPNSKPVTNLQIYNCIISSYISLNDPGTTAKIVNCVGYRNTSPLNLDQANVLVRNCIFQGSGFTTTMNTNTVYENNFFEEAQPATLPLGSNNRWGQDYGTLFNRLGGTDDIPGGMQNASFDENYYILKAGSSAINGGFDESNNPTDCGIFGGAPVYHYVISGIPPVPSFYKLEAPGQAASSNPYNITVSVRANN